VGVRAVVACAARTAPQPRLRLVRRHAAVWTRGLQLAAAEDRRRAAAACSAAVWLQAGAPLACCAWPAARPSMAWRKRPTCIQYCSRMRSELSTTFSVSDCCKLSA